LGTPPPVPFRREGAEDSTSEERGRTISTSAGREDYFHSNREGGLLPLQQGGDYFYLKFPNSSRVIPLQGVVAFMLGRDGQAGLQSTRIRDMFFVIMTQQYDC